MGKVDIYIVTVEGEPVISYRGGVDGFEATAMDSDEKIDVTRASIKITDLCLAEMSYSKILLEKQLMLGKGSLRSISLRKRLLITKLGETSKHNIRFPGSSTSNPFDSDLE
ncbi:Subtilisin-like protease SBT2.6 [Camellia lanceoleosa]|uniref:Subtilisin-like protease SBT2.6 n=1 Tax=Camellia lanceoleosa TaxID=1840588 RepID=A0ACC0ITG4_9ERIC|nr:Subtilisin-like protease SBT2.6 [Camellia lanceoleosa]